MNESAETSCPACDKPCRGHRGDDGVIESSCRRPSDPEAAREWDRLHKEPV